MGIVVEGPRFVLLDPDTDQLAGNVMALREPMKRLTPEVLLDDLPLELEAVGSVLSRHRLFSKSPTPGVKQSHSAGPTQGAHSKRGQHCMPIHIDRFR